MFISVISRKKQLCGHLLFLFKKCYKTFYFKKADYGNPLKSFIFIESLALKLYSHVYTNYNHVLYHKLLRSHSSSNYVLCIYSVVALHHFSLGRSQNNFSSIMQDKLRDKTVCPWYRQFSHIFQTTVQSMSRLLYCSQ